VGSPSFREVATRWGLCLTGERLAYTWRPFRWELVGAVGIEFRYFLEVPLILRPLSPLPSQDAASRARVCGYVAGQFSWLRQRYFIGDRAIPLDTAVCAQLPGRVSNPHLIRGTSCIYLKLGLDPPQKEWNLLDTPMEYS
jgi:hypothetical protein